VVASIRSWVIVVILTGHAYAQSPRAGGPAPGDDPNARIAVDGGISGNIARGFVNRELISARGIFQTWSGPWGLYIQPYWLYGRVDVMGTKITTDNEIYVRTGLFRSLTPQYFVYGVTVYDRSVRRQIEHRNLAGGGAGANLISRKGQVLSVSLGLLYEITDFGGEKNREPTLETGVVANELRETGRWSARVYGRWKIADGKLGLVHDLIVVPSLRDPADDYRILFYSAIDAPLVKGFSLRVSVDATQEGLIVAGTKNADLVLTFGVAYKNEWTAKPSSAPDR
jgi:hypothetical protein